MTRSKKILISVFLSFLLIFLSFSNIRYVEASNSLSFVLLSRYKKTVNIGDEFYIIALTSNGKKPKWSSSSSSIASVNSYGKVTAKKAGTATITAKINNAEASCKVTVKKTTITISQSSISIERGESYTLSATTSNKSSVTWKSSRKSVATVDDQGNVLGLKPGETTITVTADGSRASCKVKVKHPTVTLNKKKITLYRGQSEKLIAKVSSGVDPSWKSNKKTVAIINPDGTVTAIKNGTAIITATVDGVSQTCEVIVKKPQIKLSASEISIKTGETKLLSAYVSSGNYPEWSSSNPNVATVNCLGQVTGVKKGRAYIYVKEDGTKVRCTVYVTE
ncbi:Ig-like domain-containing protein [Herbinix luporum]|jgi:uncharacterized protein YjdB|uniref:Ig-like domain-containing protein n=1 Tax=Herbinix luporum TaxID=1679721 RepID=UPI001773B051|nr:Ig-like domain-containing protein [Herbinix luporum]HHT57512.1 hypothetical protein [Herbinix luporum]